MTLSYRYGQLPIKMERSFQCFVLAAWLVQANVVLTLLLSFYIEYWAHVNGKLSCTQVKCTWLLPTYVKQVDYARVRDIDSTSAKKLKANLDKSIENLDTNDLPQFTTGISDVCAPVSRHD